ncbi:hypothetical protein ACVW2L_001515 [Mucilaginibacter sp. HD30]
MQENSNFDNYNRKNLLLWGLAIVGLWLSLYLTIRYGYIK